MNLEEAQEQLQFWLNASQNAAQGKRLKMGDMEIEYDTQQIMMMINKWEDKIKEIEAQSSGGAALVNFNF